ncbi:hypothetical protein PIROE2DRAFT_62470 [Piromyces sp. E2]|nr:hypothetical protein PIROE2DRAFT_62470 [Piromyces sp. E2]|eukprot:OUM61501.1 hypothetical protein PIROE2DRAFT_62470 [Piromyces sp. E2]
MRLSTRFGVMFALGLTSKVMALNKLQSCSSLGTVSADDNCSDRYCIDENNGNQIYATQIDTTKPTACIKSPSGEGPSTSITAGKAYFFFEANNSLLTSSGTVDSGYECTITSGTVTACTSMDSSSLNLDQSKYYLNANSDNLTTALVNFSSSSSSPVDGKSGAFYPSDKNIGLIGCDSEKCEVVASSNKFSGGGNNYYLSTLVSYVIKCNANGCDNYPVTSEAYFHNAATNSANQLIYCNGSQCDGLTTSTGNYVDEDNKKLIECTAGTCKTNTSVGNFYISPNPNILIDCTNGSCENVQAKIGIYLLGIEGNQFIKCDSSSCNQLSSTEAEKIPICDIQNSKCVVRSNNGNNSEAQVLLPEGAYCRNEVGFMLY